MTPLDNIKQWMRSTRSQRLLLVLGLVLILVHLVDEIVVLQAGVLTSDTAASIIMAGIIAFYTTLSELWRMGLTLVVGLAIKLQIIGEHIVPYFKEGHTAGLATAVIALIGTVLFTGVGGGLLADTIAARRSSRRAQTV